MEFRGGWGGGGRLWKVSYINQALRYFSREIFVPTPFSQIPFSINYCHPYVQVDTSCKNIGTLKLLHCIHILHRKDYHIFSKATLNIPQTKIWRYGQFPHNFLFRITIKIRTTTNGALSQIKTYMLPCCKSYYSIIIIIVCIIYEIKTCSVFNCWPYFLSFQNDGRTTKFQRVEKYRR